jgi:isocitrate dehydrogenase
MTSKKIAVTVARGDGIGPEIMDATMRIIEAAGAQIEPEYVNVGEKVYLAGNSIGIEDAAWASLNRTGLFLKAPITTPQGGGYKSVNVTLRKSYGLYANVRPVQTYQPFVRSKHENIDMVIVRENEEDLYAGMEYRQTHDTCHSIKYISRPGSEMIIRYAFEYARANGRKKVSCLIKDNIMKISDGLFHNVFKLVAKEFPEIQADSYIVDIGMALVADKPEKFDVIVTQNLYGDIVSDIASQIAGSVGLAGSFNIGEKCAMFEAVHGSAPDIAGKGIANPSGLLNAAILMLHHIGQNDVAVKVQNAWLRTLEDGVHTGDIAADKSKAVGTAAFADAVIARLGQTPQKLRAAKPTDFKPMTMPDYGKVTVSKRTKRLTGVDIFVNSKQAAEAIGQQFDGAAVEGLKLKVVANRGVKVYPNAEGSVRSSDLYVGRYMGENGKISDAQVNHILENLTAKGLEWVRIEKLYTFDNERAYALFQGE